MSERPEGTCECVECCDGEHAGCCMECAGSGEVFGEPCQYCLDNELLLGISRGTCPICEGKATPSAAPADPA